MVSEWDCVLEEVGSTNGVATSPAMRLGLRMIKGLSLDADSPIVNARLL
jgi:hypothetical protein